MRIPGVILEGGLRPNVVPARARARFSLRAATSAKLAGEVLPRFERTVRAIAKRRGATADVLPIDNLYDEIVASPVLAESYAAHARDAGLDPALPEVSEAPVVGSLDVGTLSHAIPVLHPVFPVADNAPASHTEAFVAAANAPAAYRNTLRATRALALTGLDFLADASLRERAAKAHEAAVADLPPRHAATVVEHQEEA